MKLLDNLHQVDGVNAGAYLLIGGDGLSLIDAGLKGSDKKIMAYLRSLGYQPSDLKRILLTHADTDHIGGLRALVDASDVQTYASAPEADVIEGRAAGRMMKGALGIVMKVAAPLMRVAPVTITQRVRDGETLPMHGGIDVIGSPGHAQGHVCFYWREPKVLFVGDALMHLKELRGSIPMLTWDDAQAKASIQRLAALDVDTICFGHGAPIVGNASAQLKRLADSL